MKGSNKQFVCYIFSHEDNSVKSLLTLLRKAGIDALHIAPEILFENIPAFSKADLLILDLDSLLSTNLTPDYYNSLFMRPGNLWILVGEEGVRAGEITPLIRDCTLIYKPLRNEEIRSRIDVLLSGEKKRLPTAQNDNCFKVIFVNDKGIITFKSTEEPFPELSLNSSVYDFFDPEKQGIIKNMILKTINEGLRTDFIITKKIEGKTVPVNISIIPSKKPSEVIIVVLCQDQNTDKPASYNRENDYRYIMKTDLAFEGIVIHMAEVVIDCNESFSSLTGYSKHELIGENIIRLLGTPETNDILSRSLRTTEISHFELPMIRKDRKEIYVEVRSKLIGNKSQRMRASSVRDITRRRNSEQEIIKLKTAIDQSLSSVVITNAKGTIEYVNTAFCTVTGYTQSEAIGKNPRILKTTFHKKSYYKYLWETISAGKTWYGEFRNRKKNGEFYWEKAIISPVFNAENKITHYIGIKDNITEEKKIQAALLKSEERHRIVSELTSDFMYSGKITASNGLQFDWTSGSLEKLSGYTVDEINSMPKGWHSIIYSDDLDNLILPEIKILSPKSNFHASYRIKTKSGRLVWVTDYLKKRAEKETYMGAIKDITHSREMEIALAESKQFLDSIIDNLPLGLHIFDPNGFTMRMNDTQMKYLGIHEKNIGIGEFNLLKDPVVKPLGMHDVFKKVFKEGQTINRELILDVFDPKTGRKKNSDKRILDELVFPIFHESGKLNSVVAITNDITNRVLAEKRLKESELYQKALLKLIPDIILTFDREGILRNAYITGNHKIFLDTVEIDKHYTDIFPFRFCTIFKKNIDLAFSSNKMQTFEFTVSEDESEYFFETRLLESNKNELLVIIRDITAYKLTEIELKKAKEEAERANHAKSAFIANISHEIRTPMNAVLGFTELLFSRIEEPEHKSYLQSIKSSGNTLLSLLNDILDLSKIEAAKMDLRPVPVNLPGVFNELFHIFSLKANEKGIEFLIDIDDNIPDGLLFDELRLRQILLNLVDNAIKFTEKGIIHLVARKIRYSRDNGQQIELEIKIKDTGIGISPDVQDSIFDAFRQQDDQDKKKYKGTGLGLAITKQLTELMNGKIHLDSVPRKGTTFTLTFKNVEVRKTDKKHLIERESLISDFRLDNVTILLIDPQTSNRELLKNLFRGSEVNVIEGEESKKLYVLAKKNIPDLIILDVSKTLSWKESFERLRRDKKFVNIPVIAVTTVYEPEEILEPELKGFDAVFMKPIDLSKLLHTVGSLLKKNTSIIQNYDLSDSQDPDLNLHTLKIVIYLLETEYFEEWQDTCNTSSFAKMELFAEKIINTGKSHGILRLVKYGNALMLHIRNFDIDNINQMLNTYPDMIEELKLIVEKKK